MARSGLASTARYRTIDEARIVELLLLYGWVPEVRAGARAEAETEAKALLERLVGLGLAFARSAAGARLFDPAEIVDFLEWTWLTGAEPVWEQRCVTAARRLAREAFGGGDGPAPDLASLGPARYAVTLRRTFDLSDRQPGERVRLALPLPIEDAGLSDLLVAADPAPGLAAPAKLRPGRMDAAVPAPADGEVTLAARTSFTATPRVSAAAPASLDPAEAELYTRPSEGLIKVTPRVRALADRLAAGAGDDGSAMRRFWRFMMDEMTCGVIRYGEIDPAAPLDWLIDQGWYDCQLGSALLAGLCRARGTPARLVSGYLLYVEAPAAHTWLEVWIDGRGWLSFDLLGWDLSAAGRDEDWRDHFFGRLDHRMAVERPPRLFGGGAVRLPAAWQMLPALTERGVSISFRTLADDRLIWRDEIEVERLG